jgi:CRISPR/Cas system-associated endonuclease Cas3-HD
MEENLRELMNNKRRNLLSQALEQLHNAYLAITRVKDEEEGALESIPDNLQSSERYEQMETVVDILDETIDDLDIIIENIEAAIS